MIRLLRLAALFLLAAATSEGVASADPLLRDHELPGWDVVAEAPALPSSDPDLAEWGVVEKRVRHYTRDTRGRIQVCSVELWRFESEAQAAAAAGGFAFPGWRIDRVGASLVMVHGLVRQRGARAKRGLYPECEATGRRIRDRAG